MKEEFLGNKWDKSSFAGELSVWNGCFTDIICSNKTVSPHGTTQTVFSWAGFDLHHSAAGASGALAGFHCVLLMAGSGWALICSPRAQSNAKQSMAAWSFSPQTHSLQGICCLSRNFQPYGQRMRSKKNLLHETFYNCGHLNEKLQNITCGTNFRALLLKITSYCPKCPCSPSWLTRGYKLLIKLSFLCS